jgi:hypothetical protein
MGNQIYFKKMILRWFLFKIVSISAVLYPRWPPLLKIEISSNGQNCSILRQKVPKFELYKHLDTGRRWRTQFWKGITSGSFQQSLVEIGSIVSEKIFFKFHPKIEISSNGQNCSILSQKVPKFELYKHNDEIFNIYYGIFYELWTFLKKFLFLVIAAILDTERRWRTQIWKGTT